MCLDINRPSHGRTYRNLEAGIHKFRLAKLLHISYDLLYVMSTALPVAGESRFYLTQPAQSLLFATTQSAFWQVFMHPFHGRMGHA